MVSPNGEFEKIPDKVMSHIDRVGIAGKKYPNSAFKQFGNISLFQQKKNNYGRKTDDKKQMVVETWFVKHQVVNDKVETDKFQNSENCFELP